MVKENSSTKMEECMMANGSKTKWKVMENFTISLVHFIINLGKIAYEGMWVQDQFTGKGVLFNENPDPLNEPFNYENFDNV
jgi:hypothetical protein